jgi:hypothetical protein
LTESVIDVFASFALLDASVAGNGAGANAEMAIMRQKTGQSERCLTILQH